MPLPKIFSCEVSQPSESDRSPYPGLAYGHHPSCLECDCSRFVVCDQSHYLRQIIGRVLSLCNGGIYRRYCHSIHYHRFDQCFCLSPFQTPCLEFDVYVCIHLTRVYHSLLFLCYHRELEELAAFFDGACFLR